MLLSSVCKRLFKFKTARRFFLKYFYFLPSAHDTDTHTHADHPVKINYAAELSKTASQIVFINLKLLGFTNGVLFRALFLPAFISISFFHPFVFTHCNHKNRKVTKLFHIKLDIEFSLAFQSVLVHRDRFIWIFISAHEHPSFSSFLVN